MPVIIIDNIRNFGVQFLIAVRQIELNEAHARERVVRRLKGLCKHESLLMAAESIWLLIFIRLSQTSRLSVCLGDDPNDRRRDSGSWAPVLGW